MPEKKTDEKKTDEKKTVPVTHIEVVVRHTFEDGRVQEDSWEMVPGGFSIGEYQGATRVARPTNKKNTELVSVPLTHRLKIVGTVRPEAIDTEEGPSGDDGG